MPELPEVQCVVNTLDRIQGRTIVRVETHTERLREPLSHQLADHLVGKRIQRVTRRAKFILIHLNEGYLVIHLGMTGKLLINAERQTHDHVDIELSGGMKLTYNDARKFGFVCYEENLEGNRYLKHLGIEPLDAAFDGQWLYEATRGVKRNIKSFLLDQKGVVGLGNIYVCEILYLCGVSPFRPAKEVGQEEAARLVREIKKILRKAIELGGSSISDYRDANNAKGDFQSQFHVYGREHDRLGNDVEYRKISGRGTFWVDRLQA
jgi:formamidopyrimidine-DNA glycosylase